MVRDTPQKLGQLKFTDCPAPANSHPLVCSVTYTADTFYLASSLILNQTCVFKLVPQRYQGVFTLCIFRRRVFDSGFEGSMSEPAEASACRTREASGFG